MGNYFQNYYQAKKSGLANGSSLGAMKRDGAYRPTDKQMQYHRALVAFCKERGIPVGPFERFGNKDDCSSKIRAMITVLKKHGLADEFFGRKETKK